MKITSKEVTYHSFIEQIYFEDDSELVIKIGWPEGQRFDLDIDLEWPQGKPEWANNLSDQEIFQLTEQESE